MHIKIVFFDPKADNVGLISDFHDVSQIGVFHHSRDRTQSVAGNLLSKTGTHLHRVKKWK